MVQGEERLPLLQMVLMESTRFERGGRCSGRDVTVSSEVFSNSMLTPLVLQLSKRKDEDVL